MGGYASVAAAQKGAAPGAPLELTGWIECSNNPNVDVLARPITYPLVNLDTGRIEVTEEGSQSDIRATLDRLFPKAPSGAGTGCGEKINIVIMPIGRGRIANTTTGGDHNVEISSRIDRVLTGTKTRNVLFHGYRRSPETDSVSNDLYDNLEGITTQKLKLARVTSAMNTLATDFAVLVAFDVNASGYNSGIWNPTTDIYLVDKSGKQVGCFNKQEREIDYFDAPLKYAL